MDVRRRTYRDGCKDGTKFIGPLAALSGVQKWNKNKCRCDCVINKKFDNKFFGNPSNCKCEYKKKAAHLLSEECEEIIDNKTLSLKKYNKTVSIKENNLVSNCKPFVASSILFLLISVTITSAFIYFYVNSESKRKLQD